MQSPALTVGSSCVLEAGEELCLTSLPRPSQHLAHFYCNFMLVFFMLLIVAFSKIEWLLSSFRWRGCI